MLSWWLSSIWITLENNIFLELSSESSKGEIKAHNLVRSSKKRCFPFREGSRLSSRHLSRGWCTLSMFIAAALDFAQCMKPWCGKMCLEVQLAAPCIPAAWVWGRLGNLPPLRFSRQLSESIFSLSRFQGMDYGELHFLLSLQHVLIYRMRFVVIEFRAEGWAFSISPGVFLGTRWIAQYASGKK